MKPVDSKKINIEGIAAESGVSKTTISRYLNGKYEYMSEDTRRKIKAIIEKNGYRPSNIARSLKASKSMLIGCLIADIANPVSSLLIQGISSMCEKIGYQFLFAVCGGDDREKEKSLIQSMLDNQVDGLVVNTTGYNIEYLCELNSSGVPIVLVDRIFDKQYGLGGVTSENYNSTTNCVAHLKENGYRRVAFFTQDTSLISSRRTRKKAYLDAMQNHFSHQAEDDVYVVSLNDNAQLAEQLIHFISRADQEPSAIFASNGVVLLQVLKVMKDLNIQIARDVGVCGFDDWSWASLIGPGITTIAQDTFQMGSRAIELLVQLINRETSEAATIIEIPTQLIIRGSTAPIKK